MNQYPDFDQKLYDDLRRGKEYAFAAVFERYNRLLYTIAYRFLKSEEEAEDAIQYLFMKLWEQRTNFSFESGIRSLLFTILKNYILNELRHRSLVFEKLYEMAQQVNDEDEDDFLTQFENGELGKFLRVAIDMGITVPTVKSHYTQAIKALRNEIESLIIWFPVIWINLIV